MKRVKAACIYQTLVFSQKPELGLSAEAALEINKTELERYKKSLERTRTRYLITDVSEEADGSLTVRVRKQYSDRAEVEESFK